MPAVQVERKLEHQGKAFKMRILTLEATTKDLKQTIEDLRGQIDVQSQKLATKNEELDMSQARERIVTRELQQSNARIADQESRISELANKLESAENEAKLAMASQQVLDTESWLPPTAVNLVVAKQSSYDN